MGKCVLISPKLIPLFWKRVNELGKFPNFKAIALREDKNASEIEIDYCNDVIKELNTLARQLRECEEENHIKIYDIFEQIGDTITIAENRICELTSEKSELKPNSDKVKKNKPQQSFIDYLHYPNKDALMRKLHELLDNAKGREVARVIMALEKKKYLIIPSNGLNNLYESMSLVFGDVGSNQSINRYYNKRIIFEEDIEAIVDILP